jgi:hypothetical protein
MYICDYVFHKCDQCDKSIEAVGNEHSWSILWKHKKEILQLIWLHQWHCHSLCQTGFHDELQILTFKIQTPWSYFDTVHPRHFSGQKFLQKRNVIIVIEAVCNEHSFQYYENIKKRAFISFDYINDMSSFE